MLHYVHQLAVNFVCLLFGDGQGAYSGFISVFSQQLTEKEVDESGVCVPDNQNNHLIHCCI